MEKTKQEKATEEQFDDENQPTKTGSRRKKIAVRMELRHQQ